MHQKKYYWGLLVAVLFLSMVFSPLPANAETPDSLYSVLPGGAVKTSRQAKTFPFSQVWNLILKYQRTHSSHFSPELVACLMWEESGYRLVENDQSRALGFGQIMPATMTAINQRFKTNFTRTDLLTSPDKSVEATILALELAYSWKGSKVAALLAYAGGFQNYRSVAKWITAEPEMVKARAANLSSARLLTENSESEIVDALHLCSQPGFHPQALFD